MILGIDCLYLRIYFPFIKILWKSDHVVHSRWTLWIRPHCSPRCFLLTTYLKVNAGSGFTIKGRVNGKSLREFDKSSALFV